MKRFWLEFDKTEPLPYGISLGCGVTAANYDDAIEIIRKKVFSERALPAIIKKVEDVDVSTLDQGHVIPNMKPPHARGIWFPIGYD